MTPQNHVPTRLPLAWLAAVGVVLLLNAGFFALSILTTHLPRERFRDRVREAFAAGELVERDYLPFDARRGHHQYVECRILQMLTNERAPSVGEAVGPWLHVRDSTHTGRCRTLRELVVENSDPAVFRASFPHTRYWNGYLPVAALALSAVGLRTARLTLQMLAYGSLLLLLGVSLRSRGLSRVVGVCIAATGLAFWALPYFGQAFAHATGDILIVLAIVTLIFTGDRLRPYRVFLPFCGAFGALVVYFEFLTGQLPTAAGFLFATSYASVTSATESGGSRTAAWRFAVAGITAFALGAAITVIVKQLLVMAFVGGDALGDFAGHLQFYMRPAIPDDVLPTVLRPFFRLMRSVNTLTYDSRPTSWALMGSSALAWGVGLLLTARRRRATKSTTFLSDYLALAGAAAVMVVWVLLLPTHTSIHAGFMVRMAILPIALGWAALAWSVLGGQETASPAMSRGAAR